MKKFIAGFLALFMSFTVMAAKNDTLCWEMDAPSETDELQVWLSPESGEISISTDGGNTWNYNVQYVNSTYDQEMGTMTIVVTSNGIRVTIVMDDYTVSKSDDGKYMFYGAAAFLSNNEPGGTVIPMICSIEQDQPKPKTNFNLPR